MARKRKVAPASLDRQSLTSIGLGVAVVVIVGLLVFNYFSKIKRQVSLPQETETPTEETAEVKPEEKAQKELPVEHTVAEGEHLWKIAQRYYNDGYKWVKIAQANNLSNPNFIYPGQKLTIPKIEVPETLEGQIEALGGKIEGDEYTVQKGDDLCKIAIRAYGDCTKGWEIARVNHLANPHLIHPGNVLKIPRD